MTDPFARPSAVVQDPWASQPITTASPATPSAPASAGDAPDPFGGPAPRPARGPKMRDLYGRLVLVMPKGLEKNRATQWKDPATGEVKRQDRLTMDIVVLDGGPLSYGGDLSAIPPVAHNMHADVPARFDAVYDSHEGIISQTSVALRNYQRQQRGEPLGPDDTTMVLGRVAVGEKKGDNKPPFIFTPATDADKATARAWVRANHRDPFGGAA